MIKKRIKLICSALVLVLAATGAVMAPPVYADDDGEEHKAFLQISPSKAKIAIEPGSIYDGSYRVANIGTEEFTATLKAAPFSAADENYSEDYGTVTTYNQMASWIKLSDYEVTLKPGESKEIHYAINVPEDVPNGGQNAAIIAEITEAASLDKSLQISGQVIYKIYAKVPGQTREEGKIIENKVPSVVFGGNLVTATSLMENTGNVYLDAKVTLKVYPFGSNEEVYTNEEKPAELTVLPETRRYSTLNWDGTPQLGIYTVEQTIEFADQVSTTSKLVVVCPVWLIVIFIALILAIIYTIVSRARARKQDRQNAAAHRGADRPAKKTEKSEKDD